MAWDLSCRRSSARAVLEAAGGRAHVLPPYSPDSNPIEPAFAKLKDRLRAVDCRGVWDDLGRIPAECQNSIRHRGYTATPNCQPL